MSNNGSKKSEIIELIKEYADIREKFEKYKDKYPRYLKGNDNYIGIIGEYWATIFLEQKYEDAIKPFLNRKEERNHSNSEEWVDFILEHEEDEKKHELISVKAISSENKQSMSGKIKYFSPKDKYKAATLSVIVVKLDKNLQPEQLLYIKDLNSSLENCNSKRNYSNHWKQGQSSLAFRYYKNRRNKKDKDENEENDGFDKIFSSKIWVWEDKKFVQR